MVGFRHAIRNDTRFLAALEWELNPLIANEQYLRCL